MRLDPNLDLDLDLLPPTIRQAMKAPLTPAPTMSTNSAEPPAKRLRMSSNESTSATSVSTLQDVLPSFVETKQFACYVSSDDLESMIFRTEDLQRVTNTFGSYLFNNGTEGDMKRVFKSCEETASSLRSTLEDLEARATKLVFTAPMELELWLISSTEMDEYISNEANMESLIRKATRSTATMDFLIKTAIERIVDDELSCLASLDGTYLDLTYKKWYSRLDDPDSFVVPIKKAMEEDPTPLEDFEAKIRQYFRRDVVQKATKDFELQLETQWKDLRVCGKTSE
ncbi:hypothetical protein D6C77_02596 [Aureobasidium pullulans]|nr:hypothetical protein D6C77_02596 [Aureobasidium pullulans]